MAKRPNPMKKTPLSKKTRELMRKIKSEDDVSLLSRMLQKVMGPNFGELASHYGLSIEDTIRFRAVATRLRESREKRGMDLKAAAEALHIPQYGLRDIEECRVTQLKPSVLHAYIDFFGLKGWFARWRKANRKLAARLAPDRKSDRK